MASEVNVVGLDIAKNVFQVHGVDRRGDAHAAEAAAASAGGGVLSAVEAQFGWHRSYARSALLSARVAGFWHEVRLIAPQFVKPYLKSQKNDANDAEAICEVVARPNMHFAPSKSIEQQDLQV